MAPETPPHPTNMELSWRVAKGLGRGGQTDSVPPAAAQADTSTVRPPSQPTASLGTG